jgi:flavin-binding protein dodecin
MSGTFKLVTLVGTSADSYEQAIKSAIQDASASLRNLRWFEVKELRGRITDGGVAEFQAKIQAGFKVEES